MKKLIFTILILLFFMTSSAQKMDSLIININEIANLNSDDIQIIKIIDNEFTDVSGYQTEWLNLDVDYSDIINAEMQYCLVFDNQTELFSIYFAYTGKAWSHLEYALFKFGDTVITKTLEIGKRKILVIGYALRQYISAGWFSLSDFLYRLITTGTVKINFTGLERNLTTKAIPSNHKIILAKFYLKMLQP